MKTAIKLFLITFFIPLSVWPCQLEKNLVSMSGPITMILEELDLLEDPKLKAISNFHPIKKKTTAKIISGGLFVSSQVLKEFQKDAFYYDKSREYSQMLKRNQMNEVFEMSTAGENSFKNFDLALVMLEVNLKNCAKKIAELKKRVEIIKDKLRLYKEKRGVLFFLGEIRHKYPELLMVNDGPMLALRTFGTLVTYDSNLDYVNWSAKEMKKYKKFLKVGLNESKEDGLKLKKVSDTQYNIYFRGVLIPGIRQIYFLEEFIKLKF